MYQTKILCIGKSAPSWIQEGINIYVRRLKGRMAITWEFFKDEKALMRSLKNLDNVCLLDPLGKSYESPQFAKYISKSLHWTFLIGGAEGFSKELKNAVNEKISLSMMTFTHEATRLLLIEQLYRAVDILSGGHYHK